MSISSGAMPTAPTTLSASGPSARGHAVKGVDIRPNPLAPHQQIDFIPDMLPRPILRKTCRRLNVPPHARFLTSACFDRQPFLSRDRSRGWMIDAIALARCTHQMDPLGVGHDARACANAYLSARTGVQHQPIPGDAQAIRRHAGDPLHERP